jgi:hypothetical protein
MALLPECTWSQLPALLLPLPYAPPMPGPDPSIPSLTPSVTP